MSDARNLVLIEDDPCAWSVGITQESLERILSEEKGGMDALAVWMFYAYTGRWQRTNQPRATGPYVAKGLKCTQARVTAARKILLRLKLIEDVQVRSEDGRRVIGWFVKVLHLARISSSTNSYIVENHTPNALMTPKEKCLNDSKEEKCFNDTEDVYEEKKSLEQKFPYSRLFSEDLTINLLLEQEGFGEAWRTYVRQMRKARKNLTESGAKKLLTVLTLRPEQATNALKVCAEKGWKTLEWSWLEEKRSLNVKTQEQLPIPKFASASEQRAARLKSYQPRTEPIL
jgi:hypothetical protein